MKEKKKRMNRDEIEEKINLKAWKEPSFKKNLISHPKEALKELGVNVPPHIQIHVNEEKGNIWYITLHQMPNNIEDLSEEELKQIAAGRCHGRCSLIPCSQ